MIYSTSGGCFDEHNLKVVGPGLSIHSVLLQHRSRHAFSICAVQMSFRTCDRFTAIGHVALWSSLALQAQTEYTDSYLHNEQRHPSMLFRL